jgi:hypothetical protein
MCQVRQFIEMVSGADSLELEQEEEQDQQQNHHAQRGQASAGPPCMMSTYFLVLVRI